MHVWAVEHCPCVYESYARTISIHRKAVDAFQVMRRMRDDETEKDTWESLKYIGHFQGGGHGGNTMRLFRGDKLNWWYTIRKIEVE